MEMKKYFLGLDMGTDSVGYAVADKSYSLLKFHGEPMWGATLFDEAQLNTARRTNRTARRRLERRRQRVQILQELFAKEVGKKDPQFFIRLKESALYREDAEEPYSVFNDADYTDKDYHREFPTIHHLICALMEGGKPRDVRLVYLACAWLVAHRGHFLSEISMENIGEITDFTGVYERLADCLRGIEENGELPWVCEDPKKIGEILCRKLGVNAKHKLLSNLLFGERKAPKADGGSVGYDALLRALCGGKISAKDLFNKEEYAEIKFQLDKDDSGLAEIISKLEDEEGALILTMKSVYDWVILEDSLGGAQFISRAMVQKYERHEKDLKNLKYIIRKYAPEKYREVFRIAEKQTPNYTAYSYHFRNRAEAEKRNKKAKKEQFSKYILNILKTFSVEESDVEIYQDMKMRLEDCTFLPKQKDSDNRVIPHQLYLSELNEILLHAEAYLPFLAEYDDQGVSVSDKIRAVFKFRIPYYVGPLNRHSDKAWVQFRQEQHDKIMPWNFSEIVDDDRSEQEFIRRMTNTCTYLPGESVLPKDSLLYHRFLVLNEINNLKIDGEPIPVELKQSIFNDLFMRNRKVTKKKLENYLVSSNHMQKGQTLSGIDEQIKSDLRPQYDFRNLLSSGKLSEEQVESIIERAAYSEEKGRFVKWLKKEFGFLSEEDRSYISKLSYKDFGRLSRKFLSEFEGVEKSTGEVHSILELLWSTNNNLMELLSDRFTFVENIRKAQTDYYAQNPRTLSERLEEMYVSNAVKRPVIRSLEIVREVVKATGAPPEKIFVEMTRGGKPEQKGQRSKSRREQIAELYKKCDEEDVRLLNRQLEELGETAANLLQADRLFLYFMQLGKCMYSGENIDITKLKSGVYNIEHIYPQAYVKDDSILNNEVLVLSELNGQKSDEYPINSDIRRKMTDFWDKLKRIGLLSEEKYKRLTRFTPFSEDEKWGFINRQLTETSQSTKAVAAILSERYPGTEIVYVKARLTSEFRQEFDLLKSRAYNDLHHAKDAYLNIVTGNVYNMKFSKQWFKVDWEYSLKTKTIFTRPLTVNGEVVWDGEPMLRKVKKIVEKNNVHLTKYSFCKHGELFDQMPVKADKGLIPLKKGLPAEKYGGYNKPAVSFFLPVKYSAGKKLDVMIMPVELLHSKKFLLDKGFAESYAQSRISEILGKPVKKISFPLGMRILKVNTVLSLDGFRVCITGSSSGGRCLIAAPFMPFSADGKTETYLKHLERLAEKMSENAGYIFSAEYDKVTAEENLRLYDLYLRKLSESIYQKRPNNPLEILKKGKEKFAALDEKAQTKALLSIHQVFGRIAGGCDLRAVGGTEHAGATVSFSSNISNWKKAYTCVRIIDASASGLWEKTSDNLLELV